jgi:hypothetical protein
MATANSDGSPRALPHLPWFGRIEHDEQQCAKLAQEAYNTSILVKASIEALEAEHVARTPLLIYMVRQTGVRSLTSVSRMDVLQRAHRPRDACVTLTRQDAVYFNLAELGAFHGYYPAHPSLVLAALLLSNAPNQDHFPFTDIRPLMEAVLGLFNGTLTLTQLVDMADIGEMLAWMARRMVDLLQKEQIWDAEEACRCYELWDQVSLRVAERPISATAFKLGDLAKWLRMFQAGKGYLMSLTHLNATASVASTQLAQVGYDCKPHAKVRSHFFVATSLLSSCLWLVRTQPTCQPGCPPHCNPGSLSGRLLKGHRCTWNASLVKVCCMT